MTFFLFFLSTVAGSVEAVCANWLFGQPYSLNQSLYTVEL